MKRRYGIILASDNKNGIGYKNNLPWNKEYGKEDMANFIKSTINGVIIMGRNTAESLNWKPLPKRVNIIISSSLVTPPEGFLLFNSIESLIEYLEENYLDKRLWVIGGMITVKEFLKRDLIHSVIYTKFKDVFDCDCYFDIVSEINKKFAVYKKTYINNGVIKFFNKI